METSVYHSLQLVILFGKDSIILGFEVLFSVGFVILDILYLIC